MVGRAISCKFGIYGESVVLHERGATFINNSQLFCFVLFCFVLLWCGVVWCGVVWCGVVW